MTKLDPYTAGFNDGYDGMPMMKQKDFEECDNEYADWSSYDWTNYNIGYRAGLNAGPFYIPFDYYE